jgi:hypothetical protein
VRGDILSRKQFLKLLATASSASMLPLGFLKFGNAQKAAGSDYFRIRPVLGGVYASSFIRLCQRARFKSFAQAVKCVRDRNVEFEVYRVSNNGNLVRNLARARVEAANRPEGNKPRATLLET